MTVAPCFVSIPFFQVYIKGTFTRKKEKKQVFLLLFAPLSVPLHAKIIEYAIIIKNINILNPKNYD